MLGWMFLCNDETQTVNRFSYIPHILIGNDTIAVSSEIIQLTSRSQTVDENHHSLILATYKSFEYQTVSMSIIGIIRPLPQWQQSWLRLIFPAPANNNRHQQETDRHCH